MSRVALLDVNILLALFDPDHVHHEVAHDWFADNRERGWATCPLTELGFVRIVGNPSSGWMPDRVANFAIDLKKFRASGHHHFWSAEISLLDPALFDLTLVQGHRQLTDIYLLGLAKKMGGCLATFDQSIPLKAVVGAKPAMLEVIASVDV